MLASNDIEAKKLKFLRFFNGIQLDKGSFIFYVKPPLLNFKINNYSKIYVRKGISYNKNINACII